MQSPLSLVAGLADRPLWDNRSVDVHLNSALDDQLAPPTPHADAATLQDDARRLSIGELVEMAEMPRGERLALVHETLKSVLERCGKRLAEMPFGFSSTKTVEKVSSTYTRHFKQLVDFEQENGIRGLSSPDYQDLVRNISKQHRDTKMDIAKGVLEFHESLGETSGAAGEVPFMQEMEHSLDQFFTDQLTQRLIVAHMQGLTKGSLVATGNVGVVTLDANPLQILAKAFQATRTICTRDYRCAPELLINDVPHEQFLKSEVAQAQRVPYVQAHLLYMLMEFLKNAARASIEGAQLQCGIAVDGSAGSSQDMAFLEVPPIRVTVSEQKDAWDLERAMKIGDSGTGMGQSVLSKAFCYFYSSVKSRPRHASELESFNDQVPLAGFGFGLPMSRVYARYFSGDISLQSTLGKGTDVHLHL